MTKWEYRVETAEVSGMMHRKIEKMTTGWGQMEVGVGDGTVRRFGPGDAVLFEDLTGQGHTARTVGGDRLAASVLLAD